MSRASICRIDALSHECAHKTWEESGLGEPENKFCGAGENLLYNFESSDDSPDASVMQWLESPGHYINAMNPDFTHVSYGYYECPLNNRMYWTGLYFKGC